MAVLFNRHKLKLARCMPQSRVEKNRLIFSSSFSRSCWKLTMKQVMWGSMGRKIASHDHVRRRSSADKYRIENSPTWRAGWHHQRLTEQVNNDISQDGVVTSLQIYHRLGERISKIDRYLSKLRTRVCRLFFLLICGHDVRTMQPVEWAICGVISLTRPKSFSLGKPVSAPAC